MKLFGEDLCSHDWEYFLVVYTEILAMGRGCLSVVCRKIYGDQALGEANLEMIDIARKVSSRMHWNLSLVPRLFSGEGKEPGTHCMRMHAIATEFRRDRILLQYVRIFMTSRQSATLT